MAESYGAEQEQQLPDQLLQAMRERGIDVEMTMQLLARINSRAFDSTAAVEMEQLPQIDGTDIIDAAGEIELRTTAAELREACQRWNLPASIREFIPAGTPADQEIPLSHAQLTAIGTALLPNTAYGVLNGGSATSYCDTKKNRGLHSGVYSTLQDEFTALAGQAAGYPKGLAPGFIQPDGTPGPSFLELKLRSLLLHSLEYRRRFPDAGSASGTQGSEPPCPMFQMSSVFTHDELTQGYTAYRQSPLLQDLAAALGYDITRVRDAMQPLIAAFTHSSAGTPRHIFTEAYGKPGTPLAIPGGHGQNFAVLADTYRRLYREGHEFVYLGNVDNLGFTIDPATLGYFALSGRPAAFDFSFRTPVDVKGGVLVREPDGGLNCGDIGPAVPPESVERAQQRGTPVLFNTASGLFRLEHLVANLDHIIAELPVRLSDQDKDAGRYSQAEQVTWEIIGMLDNPLIFAVSKYRRFLAAKLLLETLLTSGRAPADSFGDSDADIALQQEAAKLHAGLHTLLTQEYGMVLDGDRYRPLTVKELGADNL